jgi:hypothetical protein
MQRFGHKISRKRSVGTFRHRQEDNVKMELREIEREVMTWIELAQVDIVQLLTA